MLEQLQRIINPYENKVFWLTGIFVLSLIVAWRTFPTIIKVAKSRNLMDEPNGRSLHTTKTPTFGGVGIYVSLMVVMTLVGGLLDTKLLMFVMGGLTILFFLGLKDDLMVLAPKKKLMGQLVSAFLLIVFTDTRILSFSSILDINQLPYFVSIVFTLFVYLLIINAFNLIDGVDGLAGSLALVISAALTILFIKANDLSSASIAVALVGSLVGFLRYNFSSKNKLFMGDTGSMVVGFLLAYFVVSFINEAQLNEASAYYSSAPALALALCFYPLMDTLRIFFIRIFVHKKSPFSADKNHVHHRFVEAGFTHKQTTLMIVLVNAVIIAIAFNLLFLNLNMQILCLIIYGSLLYALPFAIKHFFFKTKTEVQLKSSDK